MSAAEWTSAKFDLHLNLALSGNTIRANLEYNTDLFDADRMERLLGHYQTLLESILTDLANTSPACPLLTEPERQQLLVQWNPTQAPAAQRAMPS